LATGKRRALKRQLDKLYKTFDRSFLQTDPLQFVHRYSSPGDREVVGLISSSLAYGRVDLIRRSIEEVLAVMGGKPYRFTMNFKPERDGRLFDGFVHRFNNGRDISCLLYFARQMIEDSGSVGGFFSKGYRPGAGSVKEALSAFTRNVLALDSTPIYGPSGLPKNNGVRVFFPSPEGGSACKKLNLFLRWMVRRGDGLDFGLWKGVDPADLVIPLDTHIARISKNLGLTDRKSPGWRMAEEITGELKRLDPVDPVKYDFALCRLGILEKCPKRLDPEKCERCMIQDICVL
jgi:uncharacterized protein (TIGR02757 family)